MAFILPAVPYIAAAMSVVQGFQGMQQGKSQQKYYNQLAENERIANEYEVQQTRKQNELYQANQLALYGKSGIKLAGTPMKVLENTAREQELDIIAKKYNSKITQQNLQYQGKAAKAEGQGKLLGGFVSAAGSLAMANIGGSAATKGTQVYNTPVGPTQTATNGFYGQ